MIARVALIAAVALGGCQFYTAPYADPASFLHRPTRVEIALYGDHCPFEMASEFEGEDAPGGQDPEVLPNGSSLSMGGSIVYPRRFDGTIAGGFRDFWNQMAATGILVPQSPDQARRDGTDTVAKVCVVVRCALGEPDPSKFLSDTASYCDGYYRVLARLPGRNRVTWNDSVRRRIVDGPFTHVQVASAFTRFLRESNQRVLRTLVQKLRAR